METTTGLRVQLGAVSPKIGVPLRWLHRGSIGILEKWKN